VKFILLPNFSRDLRVEKSSRAKNHTFSLSNLSIAQFLPPGRSRNQQLCAAQTKKVFHFSSRACVR